MISPGIFENELEKEGINHYRFFASSDHASSIFNGVDLERNAFVDVSARTILVISPGGGSGKFGICLSQLYHEMKRGVAPRYFSLGAFPIYELPINHPLNLAYMAASADIRDKLKQDPYAANSLLTEREIENYLFEPGLEEIIETVVPRLVQVQLYQALLESTASEHSARMLAMKNASSAANDMIKDLNLYYNKARQAGITQEIAEIAGGAAALE